MTDDKVQDLNSNKGKSAREVAFNKIREEKVKQKQEEINKAVREYVEAKKVADNAMEKVLQLEADKKELEDNKLDF